MSMNWIDADAAQAHMGTQRQTLYANVSRGRIRARPDPNDPRKRLYAEDDVKRLAARKKGRPAAETLAAQTIKWGEPVLASAVSTIVDGRLYYRGQDGVALSKADDLEDVGALLWQMPQVNIPASETAMDGLSGAMHNLAQRAVADPPTLGRSASTLRNEALSVFTTLSEPLVGPGEGKLAHRLAKNWHRPEAETALNAALVLLADHELNASTFAARVAASTGAPLAACVLAGLCTLSGPLHGGVASAIAALVQNAKSVGAETATRQWLAQGQTLPAFGHTLYPNGDVRAPALLRTFELSRSMEDLRYAAEELTGDAANVDFALCALKVSFDLPEHAPMIIFSLARSVGWLAHALEQVETGQLIRPRARYNGPPLVIVSGN